MSIKVNTTLKALAEAMDTESDEMRAYLNINSGDIVHVNEEDLGRMEDGDELEFFEDEDLLKDILDHPEVYKVLPSRFDINEYEIMKDFAASMPGRPGEDLLAAIRGSGAFRRFKDAVYRKGLEKDWFAFKEKKLMDLARDWCGENDLAVNAEDK
jgi:hypothetical protein